MRLKGKKIALCVTGSVAAIISPQIARELMRSGAKVTAYMSDGALDIIHKNTMEFATGRGVVTKLTGRVEHLEKFDLILIAPATANTIGKIAFGVADTPVTSLVMASDAPVLIAPAMDEGMWNNKILKQNIEMLRSIGYGFIEPKLEEKKAKLADISDVVDGVISALAKKDCVGKKVVVTAGPTIEYIDPIRIITNKSSGKMGIAIAREAYFRGAEVRLIYGPGTARVPTYIDVVHVETSGEMLKAAKSEIARCDIFISAAAVSDFTPKVAKKKIETEKGDLALNLTPTPKILNSVKGSQAFKVGFKALHDVSEKELTAAAKKSMQKYKLDMVVANDVSKGTFGSDENDVYIVYGKGKPTHIKDTKEEIAKHIFDKIKKGKIT
ncbi:bifunctional phosphopantothenoylcysteine decarboxylase/phosphopantothenate--cysteine ligase CoaBC [archaeon]|nr:bifunctional phosphopantothenoylcysteine decarboxylase/phosphopantothenate--cysteine ligase CoaBC [archaeon]